MSDENDLTELFVRDQSRNYFRLGFFDRYVSKMREVPVPLHPAYLSGWESAGETMDAAGTVEDRDE